MVSNIFLSLARVSLFCSLITFQRRYSFQSQGSRGCTVCGSMKSAHRLLERTEKSSHYHASIPMLHLRHKERVRQQKTSAGITQELHRVCACTPHWHLVIQSPSPQMLLTELGDNPLTGEHPPLRYLCCFAGF